MTDKLPPLSTHIAPPSQPAAVPLPNGTPIAPSVPKAETAEEEEPYTIKCICDFAGDDGNTIYCETCDSWQHIECYYPDSIEDALREDFTHSCVDCKPRPLDKQKAIQRQRRRLDAASSSNNNNAKVVEEHTVDKKPKRPPPKNHKKKPKQPPTDIQTNGSHSSSSHDHTKHPISQDHPNAPPPKKSKTSHKTSHSISSQAAKRSPPHNHGQKAHGHPPSPATTPPDVTIDFDLYNPTPGFVAAYSDHRVNPVTSNSFAALNVSATLAAWPRDPLRMKNDAGCEPKDVFRSLPPKPPCHQLKVEQKVINVSPDAAVPLRYLTAPVAIPKDEPLIELNGSIDFQKDYCARPENRWDQLTFPLPFVFFHDTLPLCIDTREEGSIARFVRRSCRPTARLETYLDPGNTALYHFMLIADRDIKPGEQITLPWDFRLPKETRLRWRKLLGLDVDDEDTSKPIEPQSEQDSIQLREFITMLLGEYGGCACELGKDCAFARYNANWTSKAHGPSRTPAPKKRSRAKQPKTQTTVSPTSTGHATNSRAPSEGRVEDVPEQDSRSVSGPARSKPPSRDRTPAPGRQPSIETYGMLTAEPTEREKRKAAAFEENIRRTEEQKPKKKKARVSDGTTASSTKSKSAKRSSMSNASSATSATAGRHYIDAATSRSKSNSPASASKTVDPKKSKSQPTRDVKGTQTPRPMSSAPRPVYADHGTQTDPPSDWYLQKQDDQPRRRVVSLAKRLLQNRHKHRMEASTEELSPADKPDPKSPTTTESPKPDNSKPTIVDKSDTVVPPSSTTQPEPVPAATSPSVPTGDTDMPNASPAPSSSKPLPLQPTPRQTQVPGPPTKVKGAELRVQMPPVPAFNGPSSATSTPLSATGSVHSPFSATTSLPSPFGPPAVNGVAPSPRKKLSLSEYRKSRTMGAATKPTSGLSTSTRPPSTQDDKKSVTGQENTSPTTGKASDSKTPSSTSIPITNGSL